MERRRLRTQKRGRIMAAPLGRKAQAINADRSRRKRRRDKGRRKEIQGTPAYFTRYLERIHRQSQLEEVKMENFRVQMEEMRGRMEKAIGKGKVNKSVGSDSVHVNDMPAL